MPTKVEKEVIVKRTVYKCDKCGREHAKEKDAVACAQMDLMPRIGKEKWEESLLRLAGMYLVVAPCVQCGHPVHASYCCQFCGNVEPEGVMGENEWRENFEDYYG